MRRIMRLMPGDRIRISTNYEWAKGAAGTIGSPPDYARNLVEEEAAWEDHRRFVQGVAGAIETYWVWFDEPQYDLDGDGPYKGAEIEVDAIELV